MSEIKVKALAVMTRPELEQALEQMNVTRHDMHKLIELQQERIAELEKALTSIQDHRTQLAWAACARIARAALDLPEPRP